MCMPGCPGRVCWRRARGGIILDGMNTLDPKRHSTSPRAPRRPRTPEIRPPTVLLTGFGPFPGVPINATGVLIPRILSRLRRLDPSVGASSAILPTEWKRGPTRAAALIDRLAPDVVIHFGVSASARGFVIERRASNVCLPYPDAAGQMPAGPISGDIEFLEARWPSQQIVSRLVRDQFPVATSDDAGGYLCNAVLYATLSRPADPTIAGFVHLPSALAGYGPDGRDATPASPLTQAEAIAGILAVIEVCLASVPNSGKHGARLA